MRLTTAIILLGMLSACERSNVADCATVAAKDECISFDMCQWQSTGENTGVCKPK